MTHGPHGVGVEQGPDGKEYLDVGRPFGSQSYVQLVQKNGKTFRTFGELVPIPVSANDLKIARGGGNAFADKKIPIAVHEVGRHAFLFERPKCLDNLLSVRLRHALIPDPVLK